MNTDKLLNMLLEAIDYSFLQTDGSYDTTLTYPIIDKVKYIKEQMKIIVNNEDKAEKFIEEHTKKCSNRIDFVGDNDLVHHPWLFPNEAKKAVEIAREEMLNDICEWIDINYVHYLDVSAKGTLTANIRQFIRDLKKTMKDE